MSPSPNRVFIIAEAGVNHNGDLSRALEMIDVAAKARADAVKFQTFSADALAVAHAPKATYQVQQTGYGESQHAMLKTLELSKEAHHALVDRCCECGIDFLSTPFDELSLSFLADDLTLKTIKIGSGDLTNAPLLIQAAQRGLRVILSTGMGTIDDVAVALGALAYGYSRATGRPGLAAFERALAENAGLLKDHVVLLHCTTAYPTNPDDVNLRAMNTLRDRFHLPVGYSDHTQGLAIAFAAAALGATIIEKHFTLDRSLPGPDHSASIEPSELVAMVSGIRQTELAIGDGQKLPRQSELGNRDVARKSVVAARPIAAGAALDAADLCVKRPGTGIPPARMWDLIGRTADRAYAPDETIDPCLLQ
jgi:N-acetylneuraminate synthase